MTYEEARQLIWRVRHPGMGDAPPAAYSWSALPSGDDIALRAGYIYAVLASVSLDYSRAEILSKVPAGVVIVDYAEQGDRSSMGTDPNTSHRYVEAMFRVDKDAGTLPWKSPWPTTIFSLVHAWVAPLSSGQPARPPAPPSSRWPWVIAGLTAAGAAATWWWVARPRFRLVR